MPLSTEGPPASETPLPTDEPATSHGPRITCGVGDSLSFRASALDGIGTAERGTDVAAQTLRDFLAGPGAHVDPMQFPDTGWHRVAETGDGYTLFVALDPGTDGWLQIGIAVTQGTGDVDLYGDCQPTVVPPGGTTTGSWSLDPAHRRPRPTDTVLHVLVQESSCSSGQPPGDRVRPARIRYNADSITMTFFVDDISGDCQGAPPSPIRVVLEEPIRDRGLFDGGSYPPRDVGG